MNLLSLHFYQVSTHVREHVENKWSWVVSDSMGGVLASGVKDCLKQAMEKGEDEFRELAKKNEISQDSIIKS